MDVNCTGSYNCYTPSGTYGVLSTSNSAYHISYGAATGWDFATGIDTVNAYNLVSNWQERAVSGPSTGVTVTAGNAQATVRFTPPASNGASPITSHTVTSSLGNITATGSSSPITITGLTNGPAYTFTVTATNAAGRGSASAASNSITPNPITSVHNSIPAGTYSTIQTAYNQCLSGDILEMQATTFNKSPNFYLNKTITLRGGFLMHRSRLKRDIRPLPEH